MAYLLTAIMTGGVSAILTVYSGGPISAVLWNYVIYGHLGIAMMILASLTCAMIDRDAGFDA